MYKTSLINEEHVRLYWNELYDKNLEKFSSENNLFRDISMLVEILNIRYNDFKKRIELIENEKNIQAKEIEDYKKRIITWENNCRCKINEKFPQDSVDKKKIEGNVSVTNNSKSNKEYVCKDVSSESHEGNMEFGNSFDFDDEFNRQISEIDLENLIEMNDSVNKGIINESVIENNIVTSPKLNKNRSINKTLRLKVNKNLSPKLSPLGIKKDFVEPRTPKQMNNKENDTSVIFGTPDLFISRPKKFRQCRLNVSRSNPKKLVENTTNIFKFKKLEESDQSNSEKRQVIESDDDETMYFGSTSKIKSFEKQEVQDDELDIESILNDINKTQFTQFTQAKKLKTTIKENNLNDSYDRISFKKSNEPKYAYKESPVRKKLERELLPGWACQDCERFYSKLTDLTSEQIKEKMKECSKHKAKHNPFVLYTPPGFWNPDFTDSSQMLSKT